VSTVDDGRTFSKFNGVVQGHNFHLTRLKNPRSRSDFCQNIFYSVG